MRVSTAQDSNFAVKEVNYVRETLKKARQDAGLTQKQVAEYLKIDIRYYKAVESGERLGSIWIWDKLEDLLHINQRILRSAQ